MRSRLQGAGMLPVSSQKRALLLAVISTASIAASAAPAGGGGALEEMVITARGAAQEIRTIPVAITAVNEERLDDYGLESLMDLEAITPQLSIGRGSSGSGASIAIRGIGSTFTSIGIEQSVPVIIDGVYYPQGRAINEGLFDVSQVAVLKGPQALYFGKNATAGVISIQSNNPGDEFEASLRFNNEFESKDRTGEAIISFPVNDMLGLRLAVQKSKMEEGWIDNSAPPGPGTYTTTDGFTGQSTTFVNPRADDVWPQEETTFMRLTAAGDLSESFSYNVKLAYTLFEQNSPTGGGELFDCPTLNGVAHNSQRVDPQPPGRQTPLFAPVALPAVDCTFDGARGINDIPAEVARTNKLLNEFGDGESGDDYESWGLTGTFDYTFESALGPVDVTAILNWHDQEVNWVGDQDGGAVTSIFAGEENTFVNYSGEVRAVTRFDQPLNFVVGMYLQQTEREFQQVVNFGNVQWTGPGFEPENEFTAYDKLSGTDGETVSVYGEAVWDITEQWQITGGVRYIHETKDSFFLQPYVAPYSFFPIFFTQFDPNDPTTRIDHDQTFKKWVPEVTVRWQPTDEVTVYAAYKKGFKSGGFSNSGILGNISGTVDDFAFDPEENRGGEVGVKASLLEGSMLVTFEAFYYEFEDLQVDFFNSQQFAFVTDNAGGSTTEGAELQVTWATPVEGLTLSGSVGYLESEFTDFESFCFTGQRPSQGCALQPGQSEGSLRQNLDGNRRPGAPEWQGDFTARYDLPLGENLILGMSANVQFQSETTLSSSDPNAVFEDYRTYDANIHVRTSDGKWKLAFIGKNLTDEEAIRGAGAAPGTGGNTGTNEGFRSDLTGGAIRPRQMELELTWRY